MPYGAPPAKMPPPAKKSYYGEAGVEGLSPAGPGTPRRDERNLDRDLNAPQDRRTPPASDTERRKSGSTEGEQPNRPPQESDAGVPAMILVSLPTDAKLTIDDTPTRSTSGRRVFVSPPLEPGKTYHYTFKAEVMRDGRAVSVTKRIDLRAGQETRVELVLPGAAVARR
jgi:uncharacterized protein (TIGR03000 family)